MRRFGGIDAMKHLLALSVIFIHTQSSIYSQDTLSFSDSVIEYIDGAVMGFFLIAGFFFPMSKLPTGPRQFLRLFSMRAKRLLAPFFVFSFFYAIAMSILGKAALSKGLWLTVSLVGSSMQLYFLPLLVGCEILFVIWFMLIPRANSPRLLHALGALALTCTSLSFKTDFSTGSDPRLYPVYLIAYGTGLALKMSSFPNSAIATAVAAFALLSIVDERFADLFFVTVIFWGALTASKTWAPFNFSLPGSGGIYLLHTTIINFAIAHMLEKIGIEEIPNLICTVVLTYVVCLALTLATIRTAPRFRFLLLE